MKRYLIVPALLFAAALAGAATTTGTIVERGVQLKRGTSNVGSPVASKAACHALASTDAESRKATANYTCGDIDAFTVTYSPTPPAPVVCKAADPATTRTLTCPAGTTGSQVETTTYVIGPAPACVQTSTTSTSGACSPIVVTPPPTSDSNAGVKQGAVETKVCTTAITGKRTFSVTPATADAFAWDSLQAGDVVNISAGTYQTKLGLRGQGTAESPIIINGVTDAACNKPAFVGKDAKTAAGSRAVFGADVRWGERLGIIVVKRGPGDAYGTTAKAFADAYLPQYITLQGIEVRSAADGDLYTPLAGATNASAGTRDGYASAACVWVQHGRNISLVNVTLTGCGFGYFGMAKDGMLSEAAVNTVIANSRIYANGKKGSYLEHNLYDQGASSHIYSNFIGAVLLGSEGSSYKSRQSGQNIHDNHIVCSARCLDLVHAEDQADGVAKQADYGTDWIHDNVIVSAGPEALHYGGDNMGEQGAESTLFVPTKAYRRNALFYGNTFTLTTSAWRANVFALSERATTVTAWGNKLTLNHTGGGVLSWVGYAGQVRLGAGNVVTGKQPEAARDGAAAVNYSVTTGAAQPAVVK